MENKTITFGEVGWDSDSGEKKKFVSGKDLFLRLSPGEHTIRIIGPSNQYIIHTVFKSDDDKIGQKVLCSVDDCLLCKNGLKTKLRWLVPVIDRKTESYKLLDMSYAIMSQLRTYNKNKHWGNPEKYEIEVSVRPQNGPSGYYTIIPLEKCPLSANDQVIRDSIDQDDLKRRTTPITFDVMCKRLDKIFGKEDAWKDFTNNVTTTTSKPVVSMDDDSSEDFPAYTGN